MLIKTLLKVPVLGVKEGRLGGTVCGWLVDGEQRRIAAFLYSGGNWYDGIGAITMDHVQGIGDGAVIVHSLENLTSIDKDERLRRLARERIDGMDAPAFSPTGKALGKVVDLEIGDRGEIQFLLLEDGTRIGASRVLLFGKVVLIREPEPPQETPAVRKGTAQDGQIIVPSSVGNPIIIRTPGAEN